MRLLLLLILGLLSYCTASTQVLGTILAEWDFSDGIPQNFENGSTSGISHWEYRGPETIPSNAVCSRGACGATSVPIASQTWSNGFVIFDSNYWDNDDLPCQLANFGTGPDPAPQTAWLVTEPINLSSATGVVITFQQQFRIYQASTKVQVSINGGANWTDLIVNSGFITATSEWKTGNASSIAAGQPDVRFRFLFSGSYYHWCIDDIAVYQPNQNDVRLTQPTYTLFGSPLLGPLEDMEYDQYPQLMIPSFNFKGRASNIGSNAATGIQMAVKILNSVNTQLYSGLSNTVSLNPGAQSTLSVSAPFTPPSTLGDYRIAYQVNQIQIDQGPENNKDTLDYSITEFTYARDEGPAENFYTPQTPFLGQRMHIGNLFEIRANGFQLNSIPVAVGVGTAPGTVIKGYVYNAGIDSMLTETLPYTVNTADINSLGQEKIITLQLPEPLTVYDDSVYFVSAGNVNSNQPFRVCRSGKAADYTAYVHYPDVPNLFYLQTLPVVRMNLFPAGVSSGCTDPAAINFNPDADEDDGSCDYPGCTLAYAENYDPSANYDDGSCIYSGCTDPQADNYDPLATSDDGSCLFSGCTDPEASNFDPQANLDNGTCLYPGCTDADAANYDPAANIDDGSCEYPGCMDPEADNYNPQANISDGSCYYLGCTDPSAENYDPSATLDDGSCIISGCTNPEALNFNPQANVDDGSCLVAGCTDPEASNFNPSANQEDGSCLYPGCTDELADNYDPDANIDDGSCLYTIAALYTEDTEGCVPYTVHVINQTNVIEGSSCLFEISDGSQINECVTSFDYVFNEAGEYTISLTYTTPSGTSTDVIGPIIVSENPVVPLVDYSDGSLTCTNCTSEELMWSLDGEFLSNNQNPASTWNGINYSNGLYELTITNEFGCQASSGDIPVLQPYFSIDPSSDCSPGIFTLVDLTDPVAGIELTYTANDQELISNGETQILTIDDPGTYTVTLSAEWLGNTFTWSSDIEVTETITPELSSNGGQVVCANCSGYNTEWYGDGVLVAENVDHIDITALSYEVMLTTEDGCESNAVIIIESVSESAAGRLRISPNPADNACLILLPTQSGQLRIIDTSGRLVSTQQITGSNFLIYTAQFSDGLYQIEFVSGRKRWSGRLIVAH